MKVCLFWLDFLVSSRMWTTWTWSLSLGPAWPQTKVNPPSPRPQRVSRELPPAVDKCWNICREYGAICAHVLLAAISETVGLSREYVCLCKSGCSSKLLFVSRLGDTLHQFGPPVLPVNTAIVVVVAGWSKILLSAHQTWWRLTQTVNIRLLGKFTDILLIM